MKVVLGERLEGVNGWAQHVAVPEHQTASVGVAAWIMHLPHQGLNWEYFRLSVVALRDAPGVPPAHLHYPAAEYELDVFGLSPDHTVDLHDVGTWVPLEPPNVVHQFHGINDDQAARLARTLAAACVNGTLVAETQVYVRFTDGREPKFLYIRQLVDMWKQAVRQMVEHERTGGLHGRVN